MRREKTDEINTSLNRMEKVARQEFYEVGDMLEKAIDFIMPDDPDFAKSLMGTDVFFQGTGIFWKGAEEWSISTRHFNTPILLTLLITMLPIF